jgi:hypothetical protein
VSCATLCFCTTYCFRRLRVKGPLGETLSPTIIPLPGNFGNCALWRYLSLFGFTVYRETRATRPYQTRIANNRVFKGVPILITMENYSDSDTSSESEFDSIKGSIAKLDDDKSQDNES